MCSSKEDAEEDDAEEHDTEEDVEEEDDGRTSLSPGNRETWRSSRENVSKISLIIFSCATLKRVFVGNQPHSTLLVT